MIVQTACDRNRWCSAQDAWQEAGITQGSWIAFCRLGLALALAAFGTIAQSDTLTRRAQAFAQSIDALSHSSTWSQQQRADAFLALADTGFDLGNMASASLTGHAALTPIDKARYLAAYRAHMGFAFAEGVRRNGASTTRVLGIRQAAGRTAIYLSSTTERGGWQSVWILCDGTVFRICDAEVDGVRVSARQRRSFDSIRARDGFEGLLRALRSGALVRS